MKSCSSGAPHARERAALGSARPGKIFCWRAPHHTSTRFKAPRGVGNSLTRRGQGGSRGEIAAKVVERRRQLSVGRWAGSQAALATLSCLPPATHMRGDSNAPFFIFNFAISEWRREGRVQGRGRRVWYVRVEAKERGRKTRKGRSRREKSTDTEGERFSACTYGSPIQVRMAAMMVGSRCTRLYT